MKNIENMTKQFQTMGTMLNNWDNVVITCLPEYYRWNQWIFLKMYGRGLAYRGKALSNWCETDQTVLANENIENGKCWRCGNPVVQKEVEQWFLRITDYADRLVWQDEVHPQGGFKAVQQEKVDWPKQVQVGQNNWIGRKEGISIKYKVSSIKYEIECFTTRPDTNFGATFIVLAPEHPFVKKILRGEISPPPVIPSTFDKLSVNSARNLANEVSVKKIKEYVDQAKRKTEEQRKIEAKKKTGVFTGFYAVNDLNGKKMPIWVSDFVLMNVGTGAVVGVPGHDKRDFEFAKACGSEILRVVVGKDGDTSPITKIEQVQEEEGKMINSGFLNGVEIHEAIQIMMRHLEKKGWGKRVVTYHLRDWSVSRQRYWGTPIPIIYCRKCWEVKSEKLKVKSKEGIDFIKINAKEHAINPLQEKDLPVELPYEVDFTPKGRPPLATNEKWSNVKCPKCGGPAKRDSETLDTFFDSAWYWFRYVSPGYNDGPFSSEAVKRITPVEVYFGGSEHTLGHTMYARFFYQVFFHDLGLVDYEEFALKRIQHGVVLGPDGNRMSKSKGNVINPDDFILEYGADTVRMYLCFMMPYEATGPWSDKTIAGVNRFLNRVWKMYQSYSLSHPERPAYAGRSEGSSNQRERNYALLDSSPSAQNDRDGSAQNDGSRMENKKLLSKLQKTIKKVTNDIEKIKMNTAIAAMMEFLNEWERLFVRHPERSEGSLANARNANKLRDSSPSAQNDSLSLSVENAKKFLQILAPFAPHMTEEIWRNVFGERVSIHLSEWPRVDEKALVEEIVKIPVQVNGKVRTVISLSVDQLSENTALEKALEDDKVKKYVAGKSYKAIYIKGEILNLVVG